MASRERSSDMPIPADERVARSSIIGGRRHNGALTCELLLVLLCYSNELGACQRPHHAFYLAEPG